MELFTVMLAVIVALAVLAVVGVIKAMRKFNHPSSLDAKFLCIRCNRYYHDIDHLRCHEQ